MKSTTITRTIVVAGYDEAATQIARNVVGVSSSDQLARERLIQTAYDMRNGLAAAEAPDSPIRWHVESETVVVSTTSTTHRII